MTTVLVFRRGGHRFAIDAAAVAFIHDAAPDGSDVPLLDMATLAGDAMPISDDRALRIAAGDDVFDLRAGSQLKVVDLDRRTLRELPIWIAGIAQRAALAALSFGTDDVTWVLDVHKLATLARTAPVEAPR